ncbi:thiamine-phosphate kinase [Pedococcus bigeumensis]|uniref:Thiamine-monophosphate kinase n=1 Tax=Pedococcus bigeumensis TaxID=433644 RepID=A0A502CSH7_9MICO|nr:thiamine-phosphate kinase [Pedococcus bigeumensis]TPG16177.1 thiamine-phosphate kinase [Pedococcus bigeumensis]
MVTSPRTLADVSESDLLRRIFPFFEGSASLAVGPGDDAAVLRTGPTTVATTDSMIRGRDWLDEWSSPSDVATKLLTQNLADVAAMGATSTAVLVSLVADPATSLDWVVEFARTLGKRASDLGVVVAGGDLSSAPEGVLMVSVTALGDLEGREPVLRNGARPGHAVAVNGTLGRSAAGLALLEGGADPREAASGIRAACLAHHLRPSAPLHAGRQAAEAGASAMIDLSDGLLRDGHRIAEASGVRIALSPAGLHDDLAALQEVVAEAAWECLLAGGEEHSLLATFARDVPDGWRTIGAVEAGDGVTLDGVVQRPRGWDHFSAQNGND